MSTSIIVYNTVDDYAYDTFNDIMLGVFAMFFMFFIFYKVYENSILKCIYFR